MSVVTVKADDIAPTRNDSPISMGNVCVWAMPVRSVVVTMLVCPVGSGRATTTEREMTPAGLPKSTVTSDVRFSVFDRLTSNRGVARPLGEPVRTQMSLGVLALPFASTYSMR